MNMTGKFFAAALAIAAGTMASTPAQAHHSFAMFDLDKQMTIQGTVKDFQWTNPHVWVDVIVPNAKGAGSIQWPVEGGSLSAMRARGWNKDSLKPGDKVVVDIRPLRTGKPGGSLVKVTLADGRVLMDASGDAHRGAGGVTPIIPGLTKN